MDGRHSWCPLNPAKHEIRLLTIESTSNEFTTLSCNLSTVSLDDRPPYDALSYTWGDQTHKISMRLDGLPWEITSNLSDVLCHLRLDLTGRRLFVDALCIDQNNLAEKSTQIPLMGRVFGQAQHVHCWLGAATDGSDRAMEIFRQTNRGTAMAYIDVYGRPVCFEDMQSLLSFVKRPYWRRACVVPELILAPKAILYCGSNRMDRDELPPLTVFMDALKHEMGRFLTTERNCYVIRDLVYAVLHGLQGVNDALESKREGRLHQMTCGRLIGLTKQLATVPHDHIYAFLGLLDPGLSHRIIPDYTEDLAAVFRKFAFAWMVFREKADLLEEAVGTDDNDLKLPSWTPNFSNTSDEMPRLRNYFATNEQLLPGFELTKEGLFGVKAFCLDFVIASRPFRSDGMSMDDLTDNGPKALAYHQEWRKFFGMKEVPNDDDMYVGGGTLENAYWRTMGMERYTPRNVRDGDHQWLLEQHIDACKRWLTDIIENPAAAPSHNTQRHAASYNARFGQFEGAHLFRTRRGYIGATNSKPPVKANDAIFLIAATPTASVLRTESSGNRSDVYKLVASAYVHGTMLRAILPKDCSEELPGINYNTYTHPHTSLATSWKKIWLA